MIRNYVYAGLVLLVIGIVILYLVAGYITAGGPENITNVTVLRHSMGYVPIDVNASSISVIFVFTSNITNIYLLNSSAFAGLSSFINGNGVGGGYAYVAAHNVSKSDVFENSSSAITEEYPTNATSSRVYAVVDSTGVSPSANSVVNATVVYKTYSYRGWINHSGESLVGIVAFIIGIGLIIYGIFKKPKVVDEAPAKPAAASKGKKKS